MAAKGVEGIVDEVKTYLTTNLAAKLAAVDARFVTALTLEDIAEWRVDDPTTGDLPDALPVGWVISPTNRIPNWGQAYDYETADVVVWVLLRDQEPEILRRRCYRTIHAIWEVLKAGHFDNSITWSLNQGLEGSAPDIEMDYGEVLTGGSNMYLADARIRVQLTTREM